VRRRGARLRAARTLGRRLDALQAGEQSRVSGDVVAPRDAEDATDRRLEPRPGCPQDQVLSGEGWGETFAPPSDLRPRSAPSSPSPRRPGQVLGEVLEEVAGCSPARGPPGQSTSVTVVHDGWVCRAAELTDPDRAPVGLGRGEDLPPPRR